MLPASPQEDRSLTEAEAMRQRIEALLRQEGDGQDRSCGLGARLARLCRVAADDLGLLGSAVTLLPALDAHVISAASSLAARRLEHAQFEIGEGPARDAFMGRRPVLVGDLAHRGCRRWPGWAPMAVEDGVHGVSSIPLCVGASFFGVLTLYSGADLRLEGARLQAALIFADIATEVLLDAALPHERQVFEQELGSALDTDACVYQAQGMIMAELGIPLSAALARMRAHAWATGQDLADLASEIVAGRATLPRDEQ